MSSANNNLISANRRAENEKSVQNPITDHEDCIKCGHSNEHFRQVWGGPDKPTVCHFGYDPSNSEYGCRCRCEFKSQTTSVHKEEGAEAFPVLNSAIIPTLNAKFTPPCDCGWKTCNGKTVMNGVRFVCEKGQYTYEHHESDFPIYASAPALYSALETIAKKGCRVVHGSYPKGTTCLDMQEIARVNQTPYKFAATYRAQVLNGEHHCDGCIARAAINLADNLAEGKENTDDQS